MCFGVREVSKRTGSNPVHGPSSKGVRDGGVYQRGEDERHYKIHRKERKDYPEAMQHFLLHCPRFHSQHTALRSRLSALAITTLDLPTRLSASGVHPS
ncbi:hypothetical protein E2C01_093158 [Portunus trituberculatus]|uniref:Uncharacterized protein n=1 Tax=Portunus trituberculatus TaxID=210409 RepID=A0A5B7JTS1_PORTR|nr:hypothetical protein [Portunus trituberculatus]